MSCAPKSHWYRIVESEDDFLVYKETLPETRRPWVDRIWTYYLRMRDFNHTFCACNTCRLIIRRYFGYGKTLEDVRSLSRIALENYKHVICNALEDTELSDDEVNRRCEAATKAEPMSDARLFGECMLKMQSSIHTNDDLDHV